MSLLQAPPLTASPALPADRPAIHEGPAVLKGVHRGAALETHRQQYGELPTLGVPDLLGSLADAGLRGRGGAGFPFAAKLEAVTARRRRPVLVVNCSEGEPASAKDCALALTRPHLVLDGAAATARALRSREVHVVLPGDRPGAAARMRQAVAERVDRIRWRTHEASARFVAGESSAVLELIAGRPDLPVTSWVPAAVEGHRGAPTLLSNAETWAHVGLLALRGPSAYRALGTTAEPGTALLTVTSPGRTSRVHEVEHGAPLVDVLPADLRGRPVLLGGFHGAWVDWPDVATATVSHDALAAAGTPLGAGVVHLPAPGVCPVESTVGIVEYLAGQSAGRCGPCRNGLPALASAVRAMAHGHGEARRVEQLVGLVEGRGSCAHPDGTARLVRSLFLALPHHLAAHLQGRCACGSREELS